MLHCSLLWNEWDLHRFRCSFLWDICMKSLWKIVSLFWEAVGYAETENGSLEKLQCVLFHSVVWCGDQNARLRLGGMSSNLTHHCHEACRLTLGLSLSLHKAVVRINEKMRIVDLSELLGEKTEHSTLLVTIIDQPRLTDRVISRSMYNKMSRPHNRLISIVQT